MNNIDGAFMKKILSVLLILLIFPCVSMLGGCVKSIEEMAGTYKLVEIYSEGETYGLNYSFNNTVLKEDSIVLTLNKDETFSATYKDLNFSEVSGTWNKKEKAITFTSSGIESLSLNFEIRPNGNLLLIIDDNAVLLLEKK